MYQKTFSPPNYLNGLRPEQKIYRIFQEKHFQELWLEKRLGFIKPSQWPDPYENFLLRGQIDIEGNSVSLERLENSYFCSCWTLQDESRSMWERYAYKSEKSVRVSTSAKKVADTLFSMAFGRGTANYASINCFLGKIEYTKESDLNQLVADDSRRLQIISDTTARGAAIALMMKREEFRDEQEVRAFYSVSSAKENVGRLPVLHCSIGEDFIEEVLLHPGLPKAEANDFSEHLRANGIMAPITQSALDR